MLNGEVSVVIPTYESGHLLSACLAAVLKNKGVWEVIVVDDGSTDNTTEVLEQFPVRMLRHEQNRGPVAARNTGAKEASGKYILFLDSDVEVSPDYASELASFLEDHPRSAGVSGRITDAAGGIRPYSYGRRFSLPSLLVKFFAGHPNPEKVQRVGWVIESAFMTPRSLFEELGGFDEGFFMFHEGPDYSERARHRGYSTWYLPAVSAEHLDLHSHAGERRSMLWTSWRHYWQKHGWRLW